MPIYTYEMISAIFVLRMFLDNKELLSKKFFLIYIEGKTKIQQVYFMDSTKTKNTLTLF